MTDPIPTRVKLIFSAAAAVFALSLMASTGAMAQNASFNCRYAKSPTEVAICNSPALRALDRRMASSFSNMLLTQDATGYAAHTRWQRTWLATRRDSCRSSVDCLIAVYRARLEDVESDC